MAHFIWEPPDIIYGTMPPLGDVNFVPQETLNRIEAGEKGVVDRCIGAMAASFLVIRDALNAWDRLTPDQKADPTDPDHMAVKGTYDAGRDAYAAAIQAFRDDAPANVKLLTATPLQTKRGDRNEVSHLAITWEVSDTDGAQFRSSSTHINYSILKAALKATERIEESKDADAGGSKEAADAKGKE